MKKRNARLAGNTINRINMYAQRMLDNTYFAYDSISKRSEVLGDTDIPVSCPPQLDRMVLETYKSKMLTRKFDWTISLFVFGQNTEGECSVDVKYFYIEKEDYQTINPEIEKRIKKAGAESVFKGVNSINQFGWTLYPKTMTASQLSKVEDASIEYWTDKYDMFEGEAIKLEELNFTNELK